MIVRALAGLALALVLAASAAADAPARSPRPEERPATAAPPPIGDAMERGSDATAPRSGPVALGRAGTRAIRRSPRPETRPRDVPRQARAGRGAVAGTAAGPICGDPSISGVRMAAIPGRLPGCGIAEPVSVTSVAGVRLSRAATVDCTTASALRTWVETGVKPVVGRRGGGVKGLRVIAHYVCRTRNNQPGARISEHARGHAIDIAAIQLLDGTELSVLDDWGDRRRGPLMERLHDAACGTFGTVLGPESDRFHQNHFHLDTARYRSGSYCR